jgi:hypothetical protein
MDDLEPLPPDKALPHVVTALIEKRRELAGLIEDLQNRVKQAVCDLDNVEATLRIFAPDIDMEALGARKVPSAHHAFRGEISRILLQTLKRSVIPMSTHKLTDIVMRERGLDVSDYRLHRLMQQRVGASLRHWHRVRGVLKSTPGKGGTLIWEIKNPAEEREPVRIEHMGDDE